MGLTPGYNFLPEGREVNFSQLAHSAVFVYLGADKEFLRYAEGARAAKILTGAYWTLTSDIDPAQQVELFWRRLGEKVASTDLPPAVWFGDNKLLKTAKRFVEILEQRTQRRTLIGGTPSSLKQAGLIFGKSNPLWISHQPYFGGPSIPAGWERFAVWQTQVAQVKGVSGEVGFNGAASWWLDPRKGEKVALGIGAALAVGGLLYLWSQRQ